MTDRRSVILDTMVRLVFDAAMALSIYLLFAGHNQPGGGFVAGLVMSVAFILQYMVAGTQWVEAQMSLRPLRWMGTGLLCATLTGLGAIPLGYPFLTTHTVHFSLPLLGTFFSKFFLQYRHPNHRRYD